MLDYIRRRLLEAVPTLIGVSILVFAMMHLLPGDAASIMTSEYGMTAEDVARLRVQMGLDQPVYVQYGRFIWNALHGDLGRSYYTERPVTEQVLGQMPATIRLAAASMALAVALGILSGVLAAVRQNSWMDTTSMVTALLGVSMPTFWLGLLLIFVFSLNLGWLPASGSTTWQTLILPVFALGSHSAATTARLVRSSMLEVLRAEYITTARAKGLIERAVLLRHALKNALIPVVTTVGLQFGTMLGGAVIVETVFARQGIGSMLVAAIMKKDLPLVQGVVLITASSYVLVNLVVDLSYGFLDPRIRYG